MLFGGKNKFHSFIHSSKKMAEGKEMALIPLDMLYRMSKHGLTPIKKSNSRSACENYG